MNPIKILVFFAVHGRHDILRVCLENLIALGAYDVKKYHIIPFAVCSTKEDDAILNDYAIPHTVFPNDRLGAKKNAGLEAALNKYPDIDYMLEIGSDDLISGKLLDLYEPHMRNKVHMISCNRCYFLDTIGGQVATWTSDLIIGAGRAVHIDVLKRMFKKEFKFTVSIGGLNFDYRPNQVAWLSAKAAEHYQRFKYGEETGKNVFILWTPDKQSGLDTDSYHHILMSGKVDHEQIVTDLALVIDLKSNDNIHAFSKFTAIPMQVDSLVEHFDAVIGEHVKSLLPGYVAPVPVEKAKPKRRKK